jgi:hypothetical protein
MAIQILANYAEQGTFEGFDQPGPNHRFIAEGKLVPPEMIIPGHFYSFFQPIPHGNDQLPSLDDWTSGISRAKPYYDNYPIFLALDQYGRGFNVKLIPQALRRQVIRSYLNLVMPLLKPFVNDTGDFIDLEDRRKSPGLNPFYRISVDLIKEGLFKRTPQIKFDFLVDKYNKDEMRKSLKLIDWPHVPKIGEVNYSNDPMIVSRSSFSDYLKIV